MFSGYTVMPTRGWNRDDGIRDSHFRFEMDFVHTPHFLRELSRWREELNLRYEQGSIYMKKSDRTTWL